MKGQAEFEASLCTLTGLLGTPCDFQNDLFLEKGDNELLISCVLIVRPPFVSSEFYLRNQAVLE